MNLIQSNIQSISKDQNYNRKSSFQYLSFYKMRERSCERDHDGDLDHLRERERLDHYHNDYHYDRDEDNIWSSYPYYNERDNNRKYDCYIFLSKNYYNYIMKNFDNIKSDLNKY